MFLSIGQPLAQSLHCAQCREHFPESSRSRSLDAALLPISRRSAPPVARQPEGIPRRTLAICLPVHDVALRHVFWSHRTLSRGEYEAPRRCAADRALQFTRLSDAIMTYLSDSFSACRAVTARTPPTYRPAVIRQPDEDPSIHRIRTATRRFGSTATPLRSPSASRESATS